ncbi:beta-ribofuranosylaminobenzene 5'-phosphate synthase [Methanohalophilus sp.]|uniref:beta-ribofuranosylaminobenzene 5'-phosphate synthase n=1 Tax=Methanohalophilus sp. TaxID=1966352 RepID=UPI00262E60F5|nr:beta-ribofuranosylaminobenzene 5'-phosphate synthase [Methanohalophilus sp.]MDK2892530.1 beta-ribofuranosylaminobenzene 5-phosphate synthase [Methanohalophilus sp.]
MLEIISPSRLHISLIDLNASLGRIDGGVGICLADPHTRIRAEIAEQVEITGSPQLTERMELAASAVLPEGQGIHIHVEEDVPPHIGLGSGTQAALCAAAAVNDLYDLGMSVKELAILVGRGGTSGIGVAGFETGGFLVDCGHRFSEKGSFSPSSASKAPPAPIIFRENFPDWKIVIALPDTQGAHDSTEVDIFKEKCPIPLREVQEVSHVVLMQMLPAIVEKDIENFGESINHIQTVGFKKEEISLQPLEVQSLITFMRNAGAFGSGMSSFGPAIYGFVESENEGRQIQEQVQEYLHETIGGTVMLTTANNFGASIKRDQF